MGTHDTDAETRKIQEVGSGTYTVSLPKAWAEREGVAAGTVVDLHTHLDGLLVVEAGDRDGTADRLTVPVESERPERVERALRGAYAAGFETVVLEVDDAFSDEQRRAAGRVAGQLAGLTVVEESETRLVVRVLLDPGEVSIRQSLRQLQFVALELHREATAALVGGSAPADPASRDDQADRLYAMVDRHLARGLARLAEVDALGLSRPELFAARAAARELERVADHAERMCACATATDGDPVVDRAAAFEDLADSARGVVEGGVAVVLGNAGIESAQRTLDARDELRSETAAFADELDGESVPAVRVVDSLRRTAEHGGNVAEIGLQAALGRRADDAPSDEPVPVDE